MNQSSPDQLNALIANLGDEGKQAVAAEAVNLASPDRKKDVAKRVVRDAPLDAKKAAVVEAVATAQEADKSEVAAQAVSVAPLDAKKAAVVEAVKSASTDEKKGVAIEAVDQLSPEQQQEVADWLRPSQAVTDEVWLTVVRAFKWVLWGATVALVAGVGIALFRKVDQALIQILLTVFTTVVGVFAGFISGKALGSTTPPASRS